MTENLCPICYESLSKKYKHTLNCNHTFHYECLYNSFKHDWLNMCPYCRSEDNYLPIVNGIKKTKLYIHKTDDIKNYKNILCDHIISRGKNKGNNCNKNCVLGEYKCSSHLQKD